MANDTQDVSNVKGVYGGYGFSAPVGAAAGITMNSGKVKFLIDEIVAKNKLLGTKVG